jgi:hypothetical protein
MRFVKLSEPILLDDAERCAFQQVYPYELFQYYELGRDAKRFLRMRCAEFDEKSRVVGLSNHNGHGRQWGVILKSDRPNPSDWYVVAHCGHWPFGFWRRMRHIKWISRYFRHPPADRIFRGAVIFETIIAQC